MICIGKNRKGQPCTRRAPKGEAFCAFHMPRAALEPPAWMSKWNLDTAKSTVIHYNELSSGKWWQHDDLPSLDDEPTIELSHEICYREALMVLDHFEPKWLQAFVAGTLPPDELRRGPYGKRRPRRPVDPTAVKRQTPAETRLDSAPPTAESDDGETEWIVP